MTGTPTARAGKAIDLLSCVLQDAWSADTSSSDDWSPEVPARGQCAVSALIIQDEFGGELIRALVDGTSHYWNRLDDGTEIDATRSQFDRFETTSEGVASRDYVLSFPDTSRRYELLRNRVTQRLMDGA